MNKYIKLMRPYQWIKNTFCLSGIVFGFHFNEPTLLIKALCVFLSFCLAASSVYVLNDIFDVELDRGHPKKRLRPIASGAISVKNAWVLCIILILIAEIISGLINKELFFIVMFYIIMNLYYSKYGKHIVILDVFIISFGFLLRVFAGTYGLGIPQSEWLVLCVITVTLLLGFAKRRAELLQCENLNLNKEVKRKVLEHYEPKMLDIFIAITAASSIISYSLFVVVGKNIPYLVYTVIFVLYGIFRYIYMLYNNSGGQDTANDLLDDKHLIICVVLWVISYIAIVLW